MSAVVGVDTGGTFTDFVVLGADGALTVRKLPSTPHDPSQSVLAGILEARSEGLLAQGYSVVHGTTVATNALLQRRGAATALITTSGFRDVLAIGRQARADLYTFAPSKPPPLLPRERCFELTERLDWRGSVVTPLDKAQAVTLLNELKAQGIQSLAVCFLFSYLNPVHEQLVGQLARERGFAVSLSHDIAPEPREFERAATTSANAFVAPLMERYLTNLASEAARLNAARLRVMQSNGGALSASEAARKAIATALSGPAGGIVAASRIGAQAGFSDLLTFDMGGTSTDVALIAGGQCAVVTNGSLGDLPLRTPQLDIHTVGAGGGSLARLDGAGGLRVGPQSAGADPGPVAYGRGDTLTVTDANALLGRLPADVLLGGRVPLDMARVRARFADFARQLGRTPEQAALGVLTVADVTMTRALRHVSVERGHDPARFTLMAYGGAGGLHACALADALHIETILIPRFPGAFSALGLTLAQTRREYAQALSPTRLPRAASTGQDVERASGADAEPPDAGRSATQRAATAELTVSLATALNTYFHRLREQADADMTLEGFEPGRWQQNTLLDMRYVGQSFELRVPLSSEAAPADQRAQPGTIGQDQAADAPAVVTPHALEQAKEAFHALHMQRFGYADVREPVEITGLRLLAAGGQDIRLTDTFPAQPDDGGAASDEHTVVQKSNGPESDAPAAAPVAFRQVYITDGWQDAPVYARAALKPGQTFDGPALIVQEDATTYLAPDWRATVDNAANLVLERPNA